MTMRTFSTAAVPADTLPPGGGSPSMHIDQQRVTGAISTMWSKPPPSRFRCESGGLKQPGGGAPLELIVPVPRWERRNRRGAVAVDSLTFVAL